MTLSGAESAAFAGREERLGLEPVSLGCTAEQREVLPGVQELDVGRLAAYERHMAVGVVDVLVGPVPPVGNDQVDREGVGFAVVFRAHHLLRS
ncbi:MAG: hypothetical protein ACXWFN_13160 [Solirubrobacterales bacterium]